MPPFVANKKEAFICSQWWEKWTLRVLDNFQVVWYIKGSCFFNTAAHRGAIQASCYPMTSKTNCTTMVFEKFCIATRTKKSPCNVVCKVIFCLLYFRFKSASAAYHRLRLCTGLVGFSCFAAGLRLFLQGGLPRWWKLLFYRLGKNPLWVSDNLFHANLCLRLSAGSSNRQAHLLE